MAQVPGVARISTLAAPPTTDVFSSAGVSTVMSLAPRYCLEFLLLLAHLLLLMSALFLTLFYTRGLEIVVLHVRVP
jgi:hypothetical protein